MGPGLPRRSLFAPRLFVYPLVISTVNCTYVVQLPRKVWALGYPAGLCLLPAYTVCVPIGYFYCKLYLRGAVAWEGVGPGLPRRSLFAPRLYVYPLVISTVNCTYVVQLPRKVWALGYPAGLCLLPPSMCTHWLSLNCAWCRCLRSCGPWATRSKSGRQCVNPSGTRPVRIGGSHRFPLLSFFVSLFGSALVLV